MEITVKTLHKIDVNPEEIIEALLFEKIGKEGWVIKENNMYFKCHYEYYPNEVYKISKNEISRDEYKYIKSLLKSLKFLK